jgi:glucokinase
MTGSLAVGIDIGGTKVAAGVVDDDGRVVEQVRRDTPSTSPTATE